MTTTTTTRPHLASADDGPTRSCTACGLILASASRESLLADCPAYDTLRVGDCATCGRGSRAFAFGVCGRGHQLTNIRNIRVWLR